MTSTPLYREVRDQIVQSLVRSEWQPGEPLPSEKELAKRYFVAISTVRAAIGDLVDSDVLVRKQGKGTFVNQHNFRGSRYRFFNVVPNRGAKEPFNRKLISIRKEKADAEAIRTFGLHTTRSGGGDMYRMRIKLSARGQAFAVADVVVPIHLFKNLDVNGIPNGDESLYTLYQQKYGVNIIRVVEQLYAVKASSSVAKALSLLPDEPVLEVRRIGYTFYDVAVEQRTTWIQTRDYHYLVTQGAPG